MPLLKPGGPVPELTITTADDQTLTRPGAFAGDFGVDQGAAGAQEDWHAGSRKAAP